MSHFINDLSTFLNSSQRVTLFQVMAGQRLCLVHLAKDNQTYRAFTQP